MLLLVCKENRANKARNIMGLLHHVPSHLVGFEEMTGMISVSGLGSGVGSGDSRPGSFEVQTPQEKGTVQYSPYKTYTTILGTADQL